jgi:molybdopterin synthase catalytic subunit
MIEVTSEPIDAERLKHSLANDGAGGFCSFEGWVRNVNEGRTVERLEYEAYEPLVISEGERVLEEAKQRFPYLEARCVHRAGLLEIGELAVWVGVASAHRDEAFKACRYIIDELKIRLPIWKKEHYVDGDSGWVNCERCADHGGH